VKGSVRYHFSSKRIKTSGVWTVGTARRAVRLDSDRWQATFEIASN
jgi:hypothetical protein